jgi:glycosyltransferase involved in cell wall biosynthesis
VGSIDARKNLSLLLDAIRRAKCLEKIRLHVVGDGWMREETQLRAKRLGLSSQIEWHGKLSRVEVIKLFTSAHINLITSCKEGNPTVLWEAMASGVPTVSLDHSGMRDTICDECGVRIPVHSYEQILSDFANSVDTLYSDPSRLKLLSEGALVCAKKFSYANRHSYFNDLYDRAIAHYNALHRPPANDDKNA